MRDSITRRAFALTAAGAAASAAQEQLVVRVHRAMDKRAKCTPEQLRGFASDIWAEAVRDFQRCGIRIESSTASGEIRRSPGGRPIFAGLIRGAINLVVTDHIPMEWDRGRGLAGVTTRYEGHHLCIVALMHAHGHQVPFFSVNTCVHELLHVLMQDVFEKRPSGWRGEEREFRIDWYATRLWLFRDGAAIRKATRAYLGRLGSVTA